MTTSDPNAADQPRLYEFCLSSDLAPILNPMPGVFDDGQGAAVDLNHVTFLVGSITEERWNNERAGLGEGWQNASLAMSLCRQFHLNNDPSKPLLLLRMEYGVLSKNGTPGHSDPDAFQSLVIQALHPEPIDWSQAASMAKDGDDLSLAAADFLLDVAAAPYKSRALTRDEVIAAARERGLTWADFANSQPE